MKALHETVAELRLIGPVKIGAGTIDAGINERAALAAAA